MLKPVVAALALSFALCACGDDAGSGGDGGDEPRDPFGNATSGGGDGGTRAGAGEGARGASGSGARGGSGSDTDASADAGEQAADDASTPDSGTPGADAGANDAGGTPGGPIGTQPVGAVCANDGNCSQAMGEAVCCVNTCELVADCPESPGYLPCTAGEDCAAFGGGKICCELGDARFCTKRSACTGEEIP